MAKLESVNTNSFLEIHSSEATTTGDDNVCEIEASVCSGLESMAKEEIEEKLGKQSTIQRGRANVILPVSQVMKMKELRSVDNLMVIAGRFCKFQFSESLPEVLDQIRSLVSGINWKSALAVHKLFFGFPHPISYLPVMQEQCKESVTGMRTDLPENAMEYAGHSGTCTTGVSETQKERQKHKGTKNSNVPSFRATCYRTGDKHCFTSPQAAAAFGGGVDDYFGWNVDLENFDIEVVLCIDNDDVRVGLTLTKESLHRRDIAKFGPTTLRPTIAHGMLRMCRILEGEIVCDPMCGGGSIPIEAMISWPNARHLCGDVSAQCTSRTKNNIMALNEKQTSRRMPSYDIDVIQWNATLLPLREQYVDVFITDMPFGKRSGSLLSNWQLYPSVLREMARVCKLSTGRACILTHDRRCMAKSLQLVSSLWRRGPTVGVNIGGLASCVYVLYRTSTPLSRTTAAYLPSASLQSNIIDSVTEESVNSK